MFIKANLTVKSCLLLSSRGSPFTNNSIKRKLAINISEIRGEYRDLSDRFDVQDLASKDPIKQFQNWFEQASQQPTIKEPNAVCISTTSRDLRPSSRMVLLKDFNYNGFTFFTNYDSRKGHDLKENPYAAMLFYWDALSRQVRIEGKVEKISSEESKSYFSKRPRNSQLSAAISDQSKVITNREELVAKRAKFNSKNVDAQIEMPSNWGGYILIPDQFEFWQGNNIRLHDRLRFRRISHNENINSPSITAGENGWVIERLEP
jgi:pyridoxamine-phosphate oxidase